MKKILLSTVVVASLFAETNLDSLQKQIDSLQQEVKTLKTKQKKQAVRIQKVKASHMGDNLRFSLDLRSSVDFISEKTKKGKTYTNNVLSNKVVLSGVAKPSDDLKGTIRLELNNIYGNNGNTNTANDNSGATASETPDDNNVRVKEAFFNYFFGDESQYMLSAGKRPSVGGYPANLREGDVATSPVAHMVNMEFDGVSLWFRNGAFGDSFEDYGTNLKFCFGRGYSSNTGKSSAHPYSKNNLNNSDFGGFLLVPYDNGQYSVWNETIWAWNVKGYNSDNNLDDLGKFFGSNTIFKADGIGDEISDFLDDTKAFVSFAYTSTNPNDNKKMLGKTDSKKGYSIWIGADMPGIGDDDRFGANLVMGSKYYSAMTYGEDTLVGSIAGVRGKAVDVYYTKGLIPHLTASLRATYLKYDYAGSDSLFGENGNPDQDDYVETATDIRAYIRYQF